MKQCAKHASETLKELPGIAREIVAHVSVPEHAPEMLQEAVGIAAGFAGDAGVPGLSSGLEALMTVLEKIQVSASPNIPDTRTRAETVRPGHEDKRGGRRHARHACHKTEGGAR